MIIAKVVVLLLELLLYVLGISQNSRVHLKIMMVVASYMKEPTNYKAKKK